MAIDDQNQDGGEGRDSEFDINKKDEFGRSTQDQQPQSGQQGQQSEFGQQGETGTSTTERTGEQGSTEEGAGEGGFVGSEGEESGEYLQEDETKQAGFAEQGRGAPEQDSDIERGGERGSSSDSDIEGSSENR